MKSHERPQLTEVTVVPDVWVDGIGKVEKIAPGVCRLLFYRVKRPAEGQCPIEHEVMLSILMSSAAMLASASILQDAAMGQDVSSLSSVGARASH